MSKLISGWAIDTEDKWILLLACSGFGLAFSLALFCAVNWMKFGDEINWFWFIPSGICCVFMLGILVYAVLSGLYYMGKHYFSKEDK